MRVFVSSRMVAGLGSEDCSAPAHFLSNRWQPRPLITERLPWRSFYDPGPIGQGVIAFRWNISTTPTDYLIDNHGVIRYKWLGSPGTDAIDAAFKGLIHEVARKNQKN